MSDLLTRLGHREDGRWSPLPDWAQWLMRLGGALGERSPSRSRLWIVLAVPARAYSAVFVAMGVVTRRVADPSHGLSVDQHYLRLATTLPGTPVSVRVGERLLEGVLEGAEDRGGTTGRVIKVRVTNEEGGNETRIIPEHACYRVQFSENEADLGKRAKSHRTKGLTPFLESCLGASTAIRVVERAKTDCIVYGTSTLLTSELTESVFETCDGATGALEEVVRPKPLLGPGLPHRTWLVPATSKLRQAPNSDMPITILDGARAFLAAWKHALRGTAVVVLDRTEPRYAEGVELARTLIREGDSTVIQIPASLLPLPGGLEVIVSEKTQ